MKEHRLFVTDLDHLHQVVGGLLDVDESALGVAEDQELVVEAHVDAGRLDELGIEWLDTESAAGDGFLDGSVRKNHRAAAGEPAAGSADASLAPLGPLLRLA